MATYYFLDTNTNGNWNDGGNWNTASDGSGSSGTVPTVSDDAIILASCSNDSSSSASASSLTIDGAYTFSIPCSVSSFCLVTNGATLSGNITNCYVTIDNGSTVSGCILDKGSAGGGQHIIRNTSGSNVTSLHNCGVGGDLVVSYEVDTGTGGTTVDGSTITGNVIVNSGGNLAIGGTVTVTGNVTFNGTAQATGTSTFNVTGNIIVGSTSNSATISSSTLNGNLIYTYGYSSSVTYGTLTGNILYANYPTLYFNAAEDNDWGNLDNWWVDSSYSQKSANLPTSSTDVEINQSVTSDSSGSAYADTLNANSYSPTVVTVDVAVTVSTVANFNGLYPYGPDGSYLGSSGEIIGNAVFNQASANQGTVTGNATFNDTSSNSGTVTGGATVNYPHTAPFYSSTGNTGTINGTISYSGYPTRNLTFTGSTSSDWADTANWREGMSSVSYVALSSDNVNIQVSSIITNSIPSFIPTVNNLTTDVISSISLYTPLVVLGTATINVGEFRVFNSNYISGTFDFVDAGRTIIFDDSSYNDGTINCVGATPGIASTNTIIFNDSSYNNDTIYAPDGFSNFDFNDSSYNNSSGVITGRPTFNNSSNNQGTITGNVEIKDSASNSGTINGDVSLFYPINRNNGSWNTGTISGTTTFQDYPAWFYFLTGDANWSNINNWYVDPPTSNTNTPSTATKAAYIPGPLDDVRIYNNINSNSGSAADVGAFEVNYPSVTVSIDATVKSASFNETSSFAIGRTLSHNMFATGSIVFNDLSSNAGTINVISPGIEFRDSSTNTGTLNINGVTTLRVYSPVVIPLGGTINGNIAYYNYPFYFNDNASNDGDWNNSNNWWLDSGNTIPAGTTPTETYPGTNVILSTSVTTSSGGSPTAYNLTCGNQSGCPGDNPNPAFSISGTTIVVNGLATFQTDHFCFNSSTGGILGATGTIDGDALFKDFGTNQGGTINGLATFTLQAAENMIYNAHGGNYNGGIEFQYGNGKGVNGSSILGIV